MTAPGLTQKLRQFVPGAGLGAVVLVCTLLLLSDRFDFAQTVTLILLMSVSAGWAAAFYHNRLTKRLVLGASVGMACATVAGTLLALSGRVPFPPESEPMPVPSSSRATSSPSQGQLPNKIAAEAQVPGGCSSSFRIVGQMPRLPSDTRGIWIVSVLVQGQVNGLKDSLHYPKVRLPADQIGLDIDVSASTKPGVRAGRYLLVVSTTDEAEAELLSSHDANEQGDHQAYPDVKRIRLPPGSRELARTGVIEQRC